MPSTRSCVTCNAEFEPGSNRQKYCKGCGRRGKSTCEVCGVTFCRTPNTSGKFCSRRCQRGTRALGFRTCPICAEEFAPRKDVQQTCSRTCSGELVKQRTAKRRLMRACIQCGSQFDATYHREQKMCSRACRSAYRRLPRNDCERCGKPINNRYRHQRFCSRGCRTTQVGATRMASGYVLEFIGHGAPGADSNGYKMQHRLVVEKVLGRLLESHERIHHRNGRRDDNRPENLELWKVTKKDPAGVRAADYHCAGCRCGEERLIDESSDVG